MSHKQQAIWKTNTPADWTTELVMDDEQDWEMDDEQDWEMDDWDTIEIRPCYSDTHDESAPVCQGVGLWVGDDYIAADPAVVCDAFSASLPGLIGSLAIGQIGTPGVVLTGSDLAIRGTSICAHWMADLEALAEAANDAAA
jgi:hypothetical protein